MRVAVLGAGLQGSACAYDLLRQDDVEAVRLFDLRADRLAPFLRELDDGRLSLEALDFTDHAAVVSALDGCDVALSGAPYYLNLDLARAAVEAAAHFADLGGNTEIVFEQRRQLHEEAASKGLSVIPDVGLAPGMVNILAARGVRQLEEAEVVRIYVGGLPQRPEPPLNYAVVYSLEGTLDYYTTPSWVIRRGERVQVEPLSEVEAVEFAALSENLPDLSSRLEAFHTGGGISTLPWTYEGKVRTMEYKTLRYPGHAEIMRAIRDLGLLETEPVEVSGVEVVPRELFIAVTDPKLRVPDVRDLIAMRTIVEGRRDGERRRLVWELLDTYDEERGISAMERTTGFSLAIVGLMQGRDQVEAMGVATPDRSVPAEGYIEALRERGIDIRFKDE